MVAILILAFDQIFSVAPRRAGFTVVSLLAVATLALNALYWIAGRSGQWGRTQAYVRMLVDIVFITAGLGVAGGLAAAPFLGVYMIVPAYAGLVLSRTAALVTTAAAPVAYLGMVFLQQAGWLPRVARGPLVADWTIAAFNLLVLAVVGGLIAQLGEAYRRSRRRLASLNLELERASDESLRFNAEIQRAMQLGALGEVVAGVTHELGNVLAAALGHIATARRKVASERPDVDEHLAQVEQSFDTAARIVRAALETARQKTPADRVSLEALATQVAELKAYDLRRDGVSVRLRFPPVFPRVLAAPYQLQQVLLNLVTNAQQALRDSPPPRVIEIAGLREGDRAIVEVRDTGPGIPPAALDRIFEPFFTTKADGTGLGLAISAGIARELGGQLTAANLAGRGAVFRLSLPGSDGDTGATGS